MFILTVEGKETEGAYSVPSDNGEQVLYLFEDEDDAIRYALLLEDQDYPEMHVIEVDGKVVTVRRRFVKEQETLSLDKFSNGIRKEINERSVTN